MAGVQSVRGTDRTDVLITEQLALFHILHYKQRAAEYPAVSFFDTCAKLNFAESSLGGVDCVRHRLKFLRFQREFAVWSLLRTGQRDVLFNKACSERDGCYRNCDAKGVI